MDSLADKFYLPDDILPVVEEKIESGRCKRGIKAVQKCLCAGRKGIVILADDITPFNLVSHIPGLCLEKKVPLLYLRSRFDVLTGLKKPVSCLFLFQEEIEGNLSFSKLLLG